MKRPEMNALDARYRVEGAAAWFGASAPGATPAPPSTAVRTYRNVIRKAVGSSCPMYPSDSALFALTSQRCGPLVALTLSGAHLLLEPSAPLAGLSPVTIEGRLRWFHAPAHRSCGWLW
ncbi:MAG: hypothetical protein KA712_02235 [Myxococcales bacterium]|nr:hypothetical protein [Myxococcales bacterium]